jgi:hypothetical protein
MQEENYICVFHVESNLPSWIHGPRETDEFIEEVRIKIKNKTFHKDYFINMAFPLLGNIGHCKNALISAFVKLREIPRFVKVFKGDSFEECTCCYDVKWVVNDYTNIDDPKNPIFEGVCSFEREKLSRINGLTISKFQFAFFVLLSKEELWSICQRLHGLLADVTEHTQDWEENNRDYDVYPFYKYKPFVEVIDYVLSQTRRRLKTLVSLDEPKETPVDTKTETGEQDDSATAELEELRKKLPAVCGDNEMNKKNGWIYVSDYIKNHMPRSGNQRQVLANDRNNADKTPDGLFGRDKKGRVFAKVKLNSGAFYYVRDHN